MLPIKIESAWKGTSDCRHCGIRDMVLFADLNEDDFSQIHSPIDDMVFVQGSSLFQEGAQALGVFTLRKGLVKLVRREGRRKCLRLPCPRAPYGRPRAA